MKNTKIITFGLFASGLIVFFGLACSVFNKTVPADNPTGSPTNSVKMEKNTGTVPDIVAEKSRKPDFAATAEELDKEYTRKGVKNQDLQKYANKTIAVTGRVSMLVTEKKGTTQPWVTLYAPGTMHGVSCYFDDDNLEEMKPLKMDAIVTLKGFQNDFIVPEISPRLDHCIVLRTD